MRVYVTRIYFLYFFITQTVSLLCYNGTFTHKMYGEDPFNRNSLLRMTLEKLRKLRCSSTIVCKDNMMCFVRSWNTRAKHSWIVQRGCYQTDKDDLFPRTMTIPTRAMACKIERLQDAEYKVCFCQANWCNRSSPKNFYTQYILTAIVIALVICSYTPLPLIHYLR